MTSDIQRQRYIELDGTTNLRNLGGYHTVDGSKTTKWGVLYRCDQLADIPADKAQSILVDQLHVHNSYDLRGDSEVAVKHYHILRVHRHAVGIDTSKVSKQALLSTADRGAEETMRVMMELYREFVQEHAKVFGSIIKGLIESNVSADNASLIHCTAGKDRTGWTVYLILSLLGVKEEEKRADYLLTNTYFKMPKDAYDYVGGLGMSEEAMKVLLSVFNEFLDTGIEELNKVGGLEVYAKSHMGLTEEDLQKLRELMLE